MALLDGHPPDRLVLEMTEHAAIDDYGPLRDALAPHRAAGLRIAVDDVGTGHAGLGHLVHLDPDIVKVDRSLVEALDTEPTRAAAVEGVAGMAAHLGADLVAEGVERPATLAAAADIGFSHVQGYLLGRPERDPDPEAVTDRTQQLLAQRSPTAT